MGCRLSVLGLSGEYSGFLIHAKQIKGFNEHMVKKCGAILGLLFGAWDIVSPATGPLVLKVKIGIIKEVVMATCEPRALWMTENLYKFVEALNLPYTTLADWSILALQALLLYHVSV